MFKTIAKLRQLFDRRDKFQYAGLLVLMGFGAMLEVIGIGAVPAFIATMAVPEKIRQYPFIDRLLNNLGITSGAQLVLWGAVALIIIFAFRAAFLIFLSYLQIRLTERHRVRIGRMLFREYMNAPYEFHLSRNTAELLRNVITESTSIISGVINPVLTLTLQGLMTLGIVILLVFSTPWSGLVAIGVVGGGGWLFLRIVKGRMGRYGTEARTERKKCIQAVNQGLGGFQDARVLGVENALVDEFNASNARYARYERFRQFIGKLSNPLLEFIAVAGLMFVVLTMLATGTEMREMVPVLGLFGAAIVRLRSSMGAMTALASQLNYNMASIDAVVGDMEDLRNVKLNNAVISGNSGQGTRIALPFQNQISLKKVNYAYPDTDKQAIKDVTLTIQKGQAIGLVGETGSGKTTLINILLGLLKPQSGSITIDGNNIFDNLRSWQNNLGYISQSIYLLDDSIKHNIGFGLSEEEIVEEQLWEAIKAAQLEEFVSELPEGVNAFVGERGVRLSGGQRQRIGLARALYHNPDVLIMDEATSALDNTTENKVLKAVEALKGDRTIIMIAHRLSTVQNADCLHFLKNGRIEASGKFEELKEYHHDFKVMADAV